MMDSDNNHPHFSCRCRPAPGKLASCSNYRRMRMLTLAVQWRWSTKFLRSLLRSGCEILYCDVSVCLFVCLSVCLSARVSHKTRSNFNTFSAHVTCDLEIRKPTDKQTNRQTLHRHDDHNTSHNSEGKVKIDGLGWSMFAIYLVDF